MADSVMRELEQATQIVLAPPNIVTSEQRHTAENVILAFRKTKLPYNTCRFILENSKCDYVLFQAATTIKESVVREWTLLSAEDIESLRSFLLRFITQNISLQSYVREQILQTVAVILKRGTVDTKGANRETLFQDVTQLISSGNVTMQLVACSMLTALLNEYSSSSRTSSMGFTWEFHTRCKRAFEENDLKRVFLFALQVLNEIEKQPSPLPREATAVLNRLLSISEHVLCWEFTPKSNILSNFNGFFSILQMNQNITLKPNDTWRETLLDKNMLQLFFRVHKKVRHNSEMSHHSVQCLSQLASLNGPVFPNDPARADYLTAFIEGLLQMLASIDLQDYENLGISNIFKNLVMMFPVVCFDAIPKNIFESFINQLTTLTCSTGKQAAMEEVLQKDDTIYMEAYEKMLETWMELIGNLKGASTSDVRVVSMEFLKPHAVEVFNSYIKCHMSGPDGTRPQNSFQDEEEIDEIEQDDRDKFSDQLCSIGILGRMVPEHSIPLLARIIEDRVTKFQTLLALFNNSICRGKYWIVSKRACQKLVLYMKTSIGWFLWQISKALWAAFGRDTECAQWTVTFLLDKILTNLNVWHTEEQLMCDTLHLLVKLLDNRTRAVYVTKCELLWTLAKHEASNHPPFNAFPSSCQRLLMKALVLAGSGFTDSELKEQYWKGVLEPVHSKFYSTVCQENFTKICHSVQVKGDIINLLESLCGIAQATRVDNLERIYDFLLPQLAECVKLLDLFHNYEDVVPLALDLISEVVKKQLCFLGEMKSRKIYELCLSAVQAYSKHHSGVYVRDVTEEEERFTDILIVMELLTDLLSKDFIDFSDAEEGVPQNGGQVSAADVVLYGLNTIIPAMNTDLLKFPSLCSQYFKLIAFLAEVHPDKFQEIPEELFNSLMASVELGLSSYGSDITRLCLEILTFLASHLFQSNPTESKMHSSLAHFFKIVFHMLLLETFNMDLLETASTALFCLVCCHQDQYRETVNQLLENQTDPVFKQRLLEAFNNLTPPSLRMTITRQSKLAFMQNFDQFMINVRGFLCVK
ncbi:hypothetical protein ScPMuIL_011988 [Solemya velum]